MKQQRQLGLPPRGTPHPVTPLQCHFFLRFVFRGPSTQPCVGHTGKALVVKGQGRAEDRAPKLRTKRDSTKKKPRTLWKGVDAAGHVSWIRTSDFLGLTDNQGLIIPSVRERVIFSEGNCLKNNFCHTGCPRVRRARLCALLLIWK
jgi:hypothetical protein